MGESPERDGGKVAYMYDNDVDLDVCEEPLNVGMAEEPKKTETGAKPRTRPSRQMETFAKKASKKHAKMELKDKRTFDNIIKSIGNVSAEERFNILAEKYRSLYEEVRQLEITQMKYQQLQLENEHLNHEFGKNLLARNRLENLCRELQKQNREVKEETSTKIREEEEKRKEVSTRLQTTFDELTVMLEESNGRSLKLRDENVEMAGKIQVLCEKSQQMEDQMDLMKREMDLERQLCQSNIAKTKLEAQMEKEQFEQERKALELGLKKSEEVRAQLQVNARVMQEQIQLYVKKCDEFEKTVDRSNKMFEKCRAGMQGMTKKMAVMENDAKTWKMEWLKRDEEAQMGKRKIGQLEKLCRRLQAERNEFLKLLRNHNIDIPSVSVPDNQEPIELPPPPVETEKEMKLVVLKSQLAVLKDDLQKMQIEGDAKEETVIEAKHVGAGDNEASLVKNGDVPSSSENISNEANDGVTPENQKEVAPAADPDAEDIVSETKEEVLKEESVLGHQD